MSKGRGPLSRLYNKIINSVDPVVPQVARPLWEAPAGPKTVFFWAPFGKWALVLAGLGDVMSRPPQNVSLMQSGMLATTCVIWSRWSTVIIPKNYNLLAVNVFVVITQGWLCAKHIMWRNSNAKNAVYHHPYYSFNIEGDW